MRVGDTLLPASVEIALSPTRSPRRRSLAGSPLVAPRASLSFRPCYTDIDLAECPPPGALPARGDRFLKGHLPLRTGFQSDGGVLELESTVLSSR